MVLIYQVLTRQCLKKVFLTSNDFVPNDSSLLNSTLYCVEETVTRYAKGVLLLSGRWHYLLLLYLLLLLFGGLCLEHLSFPPFACDASRLGACEQRKVLVLTPYKARWVLTKFLHCTVQGQGICKIMLRCTHYWGGSRGWLYLLINRRGLVTRSPLPCCPYQKHGLWCGEGSWQLGLGFHLNGSLLQMGPALQNKSGKVQTCQP